MPRLSLSAALFLAMAGYVFLYWQPGWVEQVQRFDRADIDGRITWLGPPLASRSVRFRVEGSEETFDFYPVTNRPNGGFETFDDVASVGCLVVKPRGAYTLVVEADGQRHEFSFYRGE